MLGAIDVRKGVSIYSWKGCRPKGRGHTVQSLASVRYFQVCYLTGGGMAVNLEDFLKEAVLSII